VQVARHEEARDGREIDGVLTLHDSPLDPIADIPIGRIVSMQFAQVTTIQHGEVVERVPADWLLPYVHQRYDDLSVLGKKS
jgi:acetoacetate decarboxylase